MRITPITPVITPARVPLRRPTPAQPQLTTDQKGSDHASNIRSNPDRVRPRSSGRGDRHGVYVDVEV